MKYEIESDTRYLRPNSAESEWGGHIHLSIYLFYLVRKYE